MDISTLSKRVIHSIDKNSPTILTAVAVAGLVTTVVLAVKATPKAMRILEEEERFRSEEYGDDHPLQPLEIVQTVYKSYIPTVGMGVLTIGCIIGANHINLRRNAALVSLYTIAEKTLKEYQEKVVEKIGEKKEEELRGEIAQDHIDKHITKDATIILTGNGEYLCFEEFSQRAFRGNIEHINRCVNRFNQRLLIEGWLDINEFYDLIGLSPIPTGEHYGWIGEHDLLELKLYTKMAKETQEPCLVIDYLHKPKPI